jgi:hypothetical protein
LTSALEGTWFTGGQSGDAYWAGTELRLAEGTAEEIGIFAPIGSPTRREVRARGTYSVTESGELDLELLSASVLRRERFTFHLRHGWPGRPQDTAEHVVRDVYIPGDRPGTYRREAASWSKRPLAQGKTTRVRVALELAPPVADLLASPRRCTLDLAVDAEIIVDGEAGTRTRDARRLSCHLGAAPETGLLPIVIDDFRRELGHGSYEQVPILSTARRPDGQPTELGDLVERAIDRELFVDPRTPDVLLRGAEIGSSWSRRSAE